MAKAIKWVLQGEPKSIVITDKDGVKRTPDLEKAITHFTGLRDRFRSAPRAAASAPAPTPLPNSLPTELRVNSAVGTGQLK